jgi:hypothetical protein
MKRIKKRRALRKAFGQMDGYNLIDYPQKLSGIRISRLLYGETQGCSWCFPHGWEVINATYNNQQRNWKQQRKTQWK